MSSLQQRLSDLITRVGTEFKSVRAVEGALTGLSTTAKTNLVAAINEVFSMAQSAASSGGAAINDSAASGTTTYSSNKIGTLIAALILDTASDATHTWSASKITSSISNAVSAIISDTATDTGHAWSASKVTSYVAGQVSALVNGAPGALDTLKEFSDALGADPNFATTMATALGNRLRVDAAQSLTAPQQAQGQTNLDVYGKAAIGDPDTDLVAIFTAALV